MRVAKSSTHIRPMSVVLKPPSCLSAKRVVSRFSPVFSQSIVLLESASARCRVVKRKPDKNENDLKTVMALLL